MAVNVNQLVSLQEAQQIVLGQARSLTTELVPLENGGGRVLAQGIRASIDEPSTAQAAMDGYAVRSADVESASPEKDLFLKVVGLVGAGQRCERRLKGGETLRVLTGATLPEGADAVVPEEMTISDSGRVRVMAPVRPGAYLLPAGAEIRRGQQLISKGKVLRASELTALATQGYSKFEAIRQPVVSVLATGSELKEVGDRLHEGEVFASNLHTVSQLVKRCGGMIRSMEIAGDDLQTLSESIRREAQADVVVTTGGTGRGEKDLVSAAISTLDGELFFHGVAMSPGKQVIFAKFDQTLVFGLPGRPVATYVAFEQLVRPVLLRMIGLSQVFLPEITATLTHSVQLKGSTLSFLFSRLTFGPRGPEVQALRSKKQGIMAEMLASNGLIKVEPGRDRLQEGEEVRVQLLDLGLDGLSYFPES
ncbi:MAG: molybdopterin molybdotransferase MoeA [Deltaproteobacteria bacterium]|nr:MAG: molybdopterin molybdotransferase MoeA [Deltaproteobacteria bacterium]